MSFVSRPVSAKMNITAVTRRTEVIQIIAEFCRADRGRNEMPKMQIAANKSHGSARIAIISISFEYYSTAELPQFDFELAYGVLAALGRSLGGAFEGGLAAQCRAFHTPLNCSMGDNHAYRFGGLADGSHFDSKWSEPRLK